MKIPEHVAFTLDRLENNGYSAYLVGGCVRDFLMGIEPHDFDITTNALPQDIEKCFSDIKTLDIGKKHGTISICFDNEIVEVTTYRIDGEYKDSRHPESVTFTDRIEDDLSRRDFTMNAIAYSPKRGFVDPFDGQNDIRNGIIRCVGDACVRFTEDALRILRALRFSSRLGFAIENNTSTAIHDKKQLILNVAAERIRSEFDGMLDGKFAGDVISTYFDVLRVFIPHLSTVDYDDFSLSFDFDHVTRLCIFFNHFDDTSKLFEVLKSLRYDNKTIKTLVSVMSLFSTHLSRLSDRDIKHTVSEIGYENACVLYGAIYCHLKSVNSKNALERLYEFYENNECMTVSNLSIKGDELSSLGFEKSLTGKLLKRLLYDLIEENVVNEKNALYERAKQYTDLV